MRKLVKKLALVLALVLAIGCIAPASAQAAEGVRRSWNFAPGEYKPTLNLTVDQSYTLEALDYEVAMDYSIYDVAYYSYNTDALEVSMETGYAVAKAAAKNVKIKAVVLNKETGNTASFWGFVDIAEKEVVATATPTATVAPTEAPFALVSAVQTAKDQVVLTFNKDVTKIFKKADLSIKYSTVAGSNAKYNCYIKGTPEVDGDTVTVNLYTSMKDKSYVSVAYAGCETQTFQASVGKVARVEVVTTEVAVTEEGCPIKISLFDGNDILLDTLNAGDDMPDGAYCELELEGDVVDDTEIAFVTGNCELLFNEMGHTVCAIITYHTGDFDEDGEEITYEAYGEVSSIDTTPYVVGSTWTVTDKKPGSFKDAKYNNTKIVYINGGTRYLGGKLTLAVPRLDAEADKATVYTEAVAKLGREELDIELRGLTYESNNESVLLVAEQGKLIPVSAGTAEIIVKFAPEQDEETGEWIEGDVIGVWEVTVKDECELTSIYTNATSGKTVSTAKGAGDHPDNGECATIRVYGKDQYNNQFNIGNNMFDDTNVELEQLTTSSKLSKLVEEGFVSVNYNADSKKAVEFKIYGYKDGKDVKAGSYRFRVNIDDFTTAAFTIIFKKAKETIALYDLAAKNGSMDVKAQRYDYMNTSKTVATLTAWALDSSKVKIETLAVAGVYDSEEEYKSDEGILFDVSVPSGVNKNSFIDSLDYSSGKIVMDAYTNRPGFGDDGEDKTDYEGWEGEHWKVGDYKFTIYAFKNKAYRVVDTVTVTIKDGQESLSATVEKLKSETVYSELGLSAGAFSVSGSAVISEFIKESWDDTEQYCVSLWDGSTEINAAENASTYEVVGIEGFADGKSKVTLTKIFVKKAYSRDNVKTYETHTVNVVGGTITFATEE